MRDAEGPESTRSGRVLLGAALALAVGATAMLILADDAKLLRLGIVASLWSALVGAFVAAKFRRQVTDRDDELADRQAVYELELEREVAARREFELEVETEARTKAERESQGELAGLRQEILALRQNLEVLLGGEVLFERVALHAESTRMRSLTDSQPLTDSRPLTVRQSGVRRIAAAQADRDTEMIDRVHVARQPARQVPTRPEPRRPEQSRSFAAEGSERWFAGVQPASRADDLPKTVDAEQSQSWDKQSSRVQGRRTAEAEPPGRRRSPEPVAEQAPSRRAAAPVDRRPVGEQTTPSGSLPAVAKASGQTSGHYQPDASAYRQVQTGTRLPSQAPSRIADRLDAPTGSRPAVQPPTQPAVQPPAPPSRHATATTGQQSVYQASAEQAVNGRGGYQSSIEQSTSYAEPSGYRAPTGHHAGVGEQTGGHRRAADEPAAGSHASGTSVSELLAAHGQGGSPRRRRRRDDD